MDNDHHEDLPWLDREMAVRELHQSAAFDAEKISADYGKSVVSGLLFINAGALAILPAIGTLLEKQCFSSDERLSLIQGPGALFAGGAILALATGFSAYVNYQAYAENAHARSRVEIAFMRRLHPVYRSLEEFKCLVEEELNDAAARRDKMHKILKRFAIVSVLSGSLSLICFLAACYRLFMIHC